MTFQTLPFQLFIHTGMGPSECYEACKGIANPKQKLVRDMGFRFRKARSKTKLHRYRSAVKNIGSYDAADIKATHYMYPGCTL